MVPAGDAAEHALYERWHLRCPGQCRELRHRVLHRVERSGECALHRLERERRGAQANRLVDVLEDQRVLPGPVATSRPAVADIVAVHRLQLQRDVLDYVRAVSSALEPDDESPGLADAAAMISEARHRRGQLTRKSRDVRRGDLLVRADAQVHAGDRQARPVVRSARGVERRHSNLGFRVREARHYRAPSPEYFLTVSRLLATSSARITTRSLSFIRPMARMMASFSSKTVEY